MRRGILVGALAMLILLVAVQASAIDLTGKKGMGFNVGVSSLTQDATSTSGGDSGVTLGGRFIYGLNEYITLGLSVGREGYNIDNIILTYETPQPPQPPCDECNQWGEGPGGNLGPPPERPEWHGEIKDMVLIGGIGTVTATSIMPFFQLRSPAFDKFSPYMTLGMGINLNSFNESSGFQAICATLYDGQRCNVDLDNSFDLQIGAGFDYFLERYPDWAINLELMRKFNSSDFSLFVGQKRLFKDKFDGDSVLFTAGFTRLF